ncbi:MAG TPA: hypothetical protein VIV12_22410 [Streptosporangiaceae bacterium]
MTAVDQIRRAVPAVQRLEDAAGRALATAETALLSGDDPAAALQRIADTLTGPLTGP